MDHNRHRKERLFWAVSFLLALLTILLLLFSLRFFTSTPIRRQFGGWVMGFYSSEEPILAAPPPAATVTAAQLVLPNDEPGVTLPLLGNVLEEELHVRIPLVRATAAPTTPNGTLSIPSLGIEESLVQVPLRDGSWDLSGLDHQVGWLETTGAHPNAQLAMVFIGHITLPYTGDPGPFLDLRDLKSGDEIIYHTADAVYTYRVSGLKVVAPEAVENIYIQDGNKLILVTCTTWNGILQTYERRLLVEAELVKK